jgi:subtilisin family serine protease
MLQTHRARAAVVASVLATWSVLGQPQDATDPVQDQIIVQVADPYDLQDFMPLLQAQIPSAQPLNASLSSRRIYLISTPGINEATFEVFMQNTWVNSNPTQPNPNRPLIHGEIGYEFGATEGQTGSIYFGRLPSAALGSYQTQYAVGLLGVPQAQQVASGGGVRIAVLDTGIDEAHPLFDGRIAPGGWCFLQNAPGPDVSDSGNGQDDDFDGLIDEGVGHGTFVSALALLIAPESQVVPIKVLDSDGRGDSWSIIAGFCHAVDQGVDVINMSLRARYDSYILNDVCLEARVNGIVMTAAAGNLGLRADGDDREYPACNEIAWGVGATDWIDRRAPFSNYNRRAFDDEPRLVLFAPGDSAGVANDPGTWNPANCIYSAYPVAPQGEFSVWEGSSMSAAFTAGAVALLRSRFSAMGACERTYRVMEDLVRRTAVNIDDQNPGLAGYFGWGRLNVQGAALAPIAASFCDFDGGGVGLGDLTILLSRYGTDDACGVELDGTPGIGIGDLAILLSNFGR